MEQEPIATGSWLDELTPRQVVAELDKYIVGQDAAKKAVAIALRNRWRRQRVSEELRDEILPNNIILMGPTGVGKTEIARRLARLAQAPFGRVGARFRRRPRRRRPGPADSRRGGRAPHGAPAAHPREAAPAAP